MMIRSKIHFADQQVCLFVSSATTYFDRM